MKEIETSLLLEKMKHMKLDNIGKTNEGWQNTPTFSDYFNEYLAKHDIPLSAVIANSQLTRQTAYAIVNGKRPNPSKDRILALCISAGMDFDEIQKALKISNAGILYVKVKRDAVITKCIMDGVRSVMEINEILHEMGEDVLRLERPKEMK